MFNINIYGQSMYIYIYIGIEDIYQRSLRQLRAKSKTRAMIGRCKFIECIVGRKFL